MILKKIEVNDTNIDKLFDIQHNELSSRLEMWTHGGSGWIIHSIIQHQLVISELAPCEGNSYFPLPEKLRNPMKGLINIQSKDNECFRSCLVRCLNPANKNSAKIRNVDREFGRQLNFKGAKFPAHKKDYAKV